MLPFGASLPGRTTTKSPERMPTSFMLSPCTSRAKASSEPTSSWLSTRWSSMFSSARIGWGAARRHHLVGLGLHFVDIDDFDGARLGWIPPDVALALQGVEVVLDRRTRGEADRFADFAYGRWVAADFLSKPEVLQNFPLPAGQRFRHNVPSLLRRCRRPRADHLAPGAV